MKKNIVLKAFCIVILFLMFTANVGAMELSKDKNYAHCKYDFSNFGQTANSIGLELKWQDGTLEKNNICNLSSGCNYIQLNTDAIYANNMYSKDEGPVCPVIYRYIDSVGSGSNSSIKYVLSFSEPSNCGKSGCTIFEAEEKINKVDEKPANTVCSVSGSGIKTSFIIANNGTVTIADESNNGYKLNPININKSNLVDSQGKCLANPKIYITCNNNYTKICTLNGEKTVGNGSQATEDEDGNKDSTGLGEMSLCTACKLEVQKKYTACRNSGMSGTECNAEAEKYFNDNCGQYKACTFKTIDFGDVNCNSIRPLIKFGMKIFQYVIFAMALILFLMTLIDFSKPVLSGKPEDTKKATNNLGKRIVIFIVLILLPSLINFTFEQLYPEDHNMDSCLTEEL